MKKQIWIISLVFVAIFNLYSFAEETQTITLKDGSQIRGELIGVGGGVYTIHTATMGDIKILVSQVASISNGAPVPQAQGSTPASDGNIDQKIQSAQSKLMNNPQMMQQVQAMAQDPQLMQLFSDPALVKAVMSHDVKAIEGNPKAQELMNNPKMRAIVEQMQGNPS